MRRWGSGGSGSESFQVALVVDATIAYAWAVSMAFVVYAPTSYAEPVSTVTDLAVDVSTDYAGADSGDHRGTQAGGRGSDVLYGT